MNNTDYFDYINRPAVEFLGEAKNLMTEAQKRIPLLPPELAEKLVLAYHYLEEVQEYCYKA